MSCLLFALFLSICRDQQPLTLNANSNVNDNTAPTDLFEIWPFFCYFVYPLHSTRHIGRPRCLKLSAYGADLSDLVRRICCFCSSASTANYLLGTQIVANNKAGQCDKQIRRLSSADTFRRRPDYAKKRHLAIFFTLASSGRDLANIWLIMRHLLAF